MSDIKARPEPITVTASAARRIKTIIESEAAAKREQPDAGKMHLRVSVSGGGCSGFQYGFKLDDTEEPGDVKVERDGVKVVVDEMSLMYLIGSELDFVEDLTGSYFRMNNPNAASGCGCGSSFAI